MKFLIDMPLSPAIATWLIRQGHDAVHAVDLGMSRASDELVLQRAHDERRVAVTADLDYPRLLALTGARAPGLILFRGGDYSETECTGRLTQLFENLSNEDIQNSIVVIERHRIRLRRLPIGLDR